MPGGSPVSEGPPSPAGLRTAGFPLGGSTGVARGQGKIEQAAYDVYIKLPKTK